MGTSISSFYASFIANMDGFLGPLKQAQKQSDEFSNRIKTLTKTSAFIGTSFTAAGTALAAGLSGATVAAAKYGDEINKAAQRTGLSVEAFSKLRYAAEQSDLPVEALETGLVRLSKSLSEAVAGSKEQVKVFGGLGVAVKDSTGSMRPLNAVLLDLSEKFERMPDSAEKSALALQVFGKGGAAMIPFLNEGPRGIEKLTEAADRLGLVIGKSTAEAATRFTDDLDDLQHAATGLAGAIGKTLIPTLTTVAEKTRDAIQYTKGFVSTNENVTKVVAGTSLALLGSGGLALGFAAIGTVVPKVIVGFTEVALAAKAAAGSVIGFAEALKIAGAISLTDIKSVGDLSAAISLIGESSALAKLGLVGMAAAIGVGIGSAVNYALKLTDLEGVFDKIIALEVNRIPLLGKYVTGQNAAANAARDLGGVTAKLAEELAKHGVIVDRGSDSIQEWNQRVLTAARNSDQYKRAVADQAEALSFNRAAHRAAIDVLTEYFKAQDEAAEASKKRTEEQKKLIESFSQALKPADALNKELGLLTGRFSDSELITVYGAKIVDAAAAQRAHGIEVSGVTARLEEQALQIDRIIETMKNLRKFQEENVRKPIDLGFDVKLPDLNGIALQNIKGLAPATSQVAVFTETTNNAIDAMIRARKDATGLSLSVDELTKSNFSSSQILALLGPQFDGVADSAKRYGIQLDEPTKQLIKQREATKSAAAEAMKWRAVWSQAMGNVVSDFSKAVTDMIFHSKNLASSLKGIFLSLAESVTRIFTNDLFLKIGKGLSGILLGTGGKTAPSAAADLGGLVPAAGAVAAGGIAAGGAAGAGAAGLGGLVVTGGAPATGLAGALGLGGGSGLLGLGAATIPVIGAAIAGSILVAEKLTGRGRKTANEFVQDIENPFGQSIVSISNAVQSSVRAGTATTDQIKSAQKAMADLVAKFETASSNFASQGSREQTVVAQSKAHFEELFGPGFSKLFNDLSSSLTGVKAGTSAAGIPQTGLAQSASKVFSDAAKLFSDGVKTFLKDKDEAARSVTVNIAPPQITVNADFNVVTIDDATLRNDIAPKLTDMLKNNTRGMLEDWAKVIIDAGDGLVNVEI